MGGNHHVPPVSRPRLCEVIQLMDSDEPRGIRIDSIEDMLQPIDAYVLDRPVVGRIDARTRDLGGTRRRQAARLIMERTSTAVKAGYR